MVKRAIQIDEQRCVGCRLCVNACQQGALELIDGKARVVRDDYCDGLGMCLPVCPVEAISFSDGPLKAERMPVEKSSQPPQSSTGCPGSLSQFFAREDAATQERDLSVKNTSQLIQWPLQIKLMPTVASFYDQADLLIAADCTAYSCGSFHEDFMKGKITIIGCPKLDEGDYAEKLTTIIRENVIRSVTVARMEVPCCGGMQRATQSAVQTSGKNLSCKIVTISTDGKILS